MISTLQSAGFTVTLCAGRIELALGGELSRGELCETCRQCVYYRKGEIG